MPARSSPEALAEARWQAFATIEETADLMASYARSIGEAAWRRDQVELAVHIRQVIDCARSMARMYREGGLGDGQNGPGQKAGAAGEGQAVKAGDGMGTDRSS